MQEVASQGYQSFGALLDRVTAKGDEDALEDLREGTDLRWKAQVATLVEPRDTGALEQHAVDRRCCCERPLALPNRHAPTLLLPAEVGCLRRRGPPLVRSSLHPASGTAARDASQHFQNTSRHILFRTSTVVLQAETPTVHARGEVRTVKLSYDTQVDTFEDALAAVYAAYGRTREDDGTVEGADDDEDAGADSGYLPGRWNARRLRKLAEWLGESDAAVAVRYIAEHAPAVSMDSVFEHMAEHTGLANFDGKAMGGRMSAVGFARNNIGGGVGPVYETDYGNRQYRMDKRLAAAILEEMDALAG